MRRGFFVSVNVLTAVMLRACFLMCGGTISVTSSDEVRDVYALVASVAHIGDCRHVARLLLLLAQCSETITSGETRDKEVGARVSKHKIMANPIIWAYLIVIFIVLAVTVYLIFLYPEAAHRGS